MIPLAPVRRAERVRRLSEKLEEIAAGDASLLGVQHLAVELNGREILKDVSFDVNGAS